MTYWLPQDSLQLKLIHGDGGNSITNIIPIDDCKGCMRQYM